MRVSVDTGRCCGAGTCVLVAPRVFDQTDDEGMVVLVDPCPPRELWNDVREAAVACPRSAIDVDDEE
ncbi:ferredoxin [Microbispora sp. KK1-11]|uniref:ferredoxin n=1 Tax=Microbispora sp. KK1-11 TaxID=2053005 RepID=UPI00115C22ED|nr:ferredoxin [Microbispora sp. KK1-11]TQS26509.1 ferredoxin [Microbispora sp. KK1-11]